MSTVAYLAVSPEGRTDRHCLLLSDGHGPGPAPAHRRRPRRGRRRGGADRPRRAGGQRPLQRRPRPLALRRLHADGLAPARRRPRRHRAHHRGLPARRRAGRGGRLRQHRGARRAQLPPQRVLEPQAQPARRPVRRLGGEPRPLRPHRPAHGARRGRARTWRSRPSSTWPTAWTAACGSTRASRSPRSSRPTARSMRWSSPAAARSPTRCTSSGATRRCREFGATLPAPVRLGFRVIGHRFLRAYPYEEAFFLPYARQFQRALSTPLILLGGITELATIEWRSPRASRSSPWPAPCCASRTCPTACRPARRPRRSASTATSACPPSTRARAASW